MDNQLDNSTKVVIDLFNRQYSQFDDTLKRIIDSNDKAHDQLFDKISVLTSEVHEINTTVKIIVTNQASQEKRLDSFNDKLQKLSSRVDEIESSHSKKEHVWQVAGKILAAAVAISALVGAILKYFGIF